MVHFSQKSVKMAANGGSLKCKPPFAEFGDSHVIAELPLVTAIPAETGDVEVRRSTGVNRLPHHRPCDISSKQNYSNRLHSGDLIVLGLIEVLWLSEDRYKILTIFRTSSFNAGEYIDHKIQI